MTFMVACSVVMAFALGFSTGLRVQYNRTQRWLCRIYGHLPVEHAIAFAEAREKARQEAER